MTVGAAIQDVEGAWEDSRMQWRISIHERPEVARGFQVDLPLTGRPKLTFWAFSPVASVRQCRNQDRLLQVLPLAISPI